MKPEEVMEFIEDKMELFYQRDKSTIEKVVYSIQKEQVSIKMLLKKIIDMLEKII